ncbi:MAG TPA: hypothetical protein PKE27_06195 [Povalibacter sp.]|mgnify:CR=1 FL=1|uniref:hypothetical protein n=1 Tax=Povalibacter sp. TaxID=1962978 RepID=UPI002B55BB8F|nr:hypothetical protein [Povalibacter sp.]HMN44139.1 hypothetical protein [Povalibacter sp.]
MTRTETDRDDPSEGKSGASPSAPGTGAKSETVKADPTTDEAKVADTLPQASPVPDVQRALEESRRYPAKAEEVSAPERTYRPE